MPGPFRLRPNMTKGPGDEVVLNLHAAQASFDVTLLRTLESLPGVLCEHAANIHIKLHEISK